MMHDDWDSESPPPTVKNARVIPEHDERYVVRVTSENPASFYERGYETPTPPPSLSRESAARDRVRRRKVSGRQSGGEWAWVVIAVALFGVVITLSLTVAVVMRASREQEILPTAAFSLAALPTAVDLGSSSAVPGVSALELGDGRRIALTPWDGQGRLTILLMGLDRRPGETGLGYRTDTMLLLSLDPRNQSVGVLSIPRDLYVDVPGYSALRRINEPMALGELQRLNYGPILAMETVQYNLGIRVNHYIIVDFQAFVQIIDALGGIEVMTDYVIDDQYYPTMNYGYERFYLAAGRNLLDGQTALKFARTRHGDSDIERGKRQQQVIFALLDKVSKAENLPQVIGQVPALWNALQGNFYTNLSLDQMVQLGLYVKDIPREKINSGSISYEYLMDYTTPQGAQVLIPNRARLGELMASVFGASYSE